MSPLCFFGRCPGKGCKHRRVIDSANHPQLQETFANKSRPTVVLVDSEGRDWPLVRLGVPEQARAMKAAGFECPEHERVVWFEQGRFSYNPERECNGACMGATEAWDETYGPSDPVRDDIRQYITTAVAESSGVQDLILGNGGTIQFR